MFGLGSKSIVGLDVGSSSIKAVELKKKGGQIEVAHLGLEPLAFQEIEIGPVDGREVERNGTAVETQTEGGIESCRVTVKVGTCLDWDRSPLLAWM